MKTIELLKQKGTTKDNEMASTFGISKENVRETVPKGR